jgi:hypothetical protein
MLVKDISWIAHKYGLRKKDLAEILFREVRGNIAGTKA